MIAGGYTIAYQRCCRISGIENISGNSSDDGATYSCDIPGTDILPLPVIIQVRLFPAMMQ